MTTRIFNRNKKPNNNREVFDSWQVEKVLGSGGFGEVRLWKNHSTGQTIATKSLLRKKISDDQIGKVSERWRTEFDMMNDLKSPFIVKALQLKDQAFVKFLNDNYSDSPSLPVIIMEYCNAGDLRAFLRKPSNMNGLPEKDVKDVLNCLRHAIEYLHKNCKIEHRDLKPENIVISEIDSKRCYKLTDLGLARKNETDKTLIQSQVGTKFYFAPEVLSGKYSKTVDYWSYGVIAFEIICGVLPFIPHQSIPKVIEAIQEKPRSCIAITMCPQTKVIQHQDKLFPQNRLSDVFQRQIEPWLQMALDIDRQNRGFRLRESISANPGPPTLEIFNDIDHINEMKILTAFCLNNCKYFFYNLTSFKQMSQMEEAFQKDLGFKPIIILPIGHPVKSRQIQEIKPSDYYYEDWSDVWKDNHDILSNPPAMIYLVKGSKGNSLSAKKSTSSLQETPSMSYDFDRSLISNTIQTCSRLNPEKLEDIPNWYIEEFAVHAHHLLCSEQRRLKAIICGLRDFALEIDHAIFNFNINPVCDGCLIVESKIEQFRDMQNLSQEEFQSHTETVKALREIREKLKQRHSSAMKIIKEVISHEINEKLVKADKFNIISFRNQVDSNWHNKQLLFVCVDKAVKEGLNTMNKLYSGEIKGHMEKIEYADKLFNEIQRLAFDTFRYLQNLDSQLRRKTENFRNASLSQLTPVPTNDYESLEHMLNRMELDMDMHMGGELESVPATIMEVIEI